MMILSPRASESEARKIADADPAVQSRFLDFEIKPWMRVLKKAIGVCCSTTQKFTWPVKDPEGNSVEKETTTELEVYLEDLEVARVYARQAAWKMCNQTLGIQFNEHWEKFGVKNAPKPLDEFGDPRPPKICVDAYRDELLYSCQEIFQ